MYIKVVERFKHEGKTYEVGEEHDLEPRLAYHFIGQGWAEDEDGNSGTLQRNKHVKLDPQ